MADARNVPDDGERQLESLLSLDRPDTDDFRSMFQLCHELRSSSLVKAEACLRRVLESAARVGHQTAICLGHQRMTEVYIARGDLAAARAEAEELMKSAQASGELRYEASHHWLVGRVNEESGRLDEARSSYERALEVWRRAGVAAGERAVSNSLGGLAWYQGRFAEALEYYRRCLELCDDTVSDDERVIAQHNAGAALMALGRWEDAAETYHRALALAEHSGSERTRTLCRCRVLDAMGELLLRRDLLDQATDCLEEVVELSRRYDSVRAEHLAEVLAHLGQAYHRQGNLAAAEQAYAEGLRTASDFSDHKCRAMVLWRAAELAQAQGRPETAEGYLAEAVTLATEIGFRIELAHSWRVYALLHAARGEPDKARDCFERALLTLEDMDENYDAAKVRLDYGRFLLDRGERAAGESHLRAAARVLRGLGAVNEVGEASRLLFGQERAIDGDAALLQAVSQLATLGLEPRRFLERVLDVLCAATGCDAGAILIDSDLLVAHGRPDMAAARRTVSMVDLGRGSPGLSWVVWQSGTVVARVCLLRPARDQPRPTRFVLEAVNSLLQPAFQRLASGVNLKGTSGAGRLRYRGVAGRSRQMSELLSQVQRAAAGRSPVLILGEPGTGRELLARALHDTGSGASGPFVTLHCHAVPEGLLDAELFGTSQAPRDSGRLAQARGGSLYLDGVTGLSPAVQHKLARTPAEEGGALQDVRVIAASDRDLDELVARGEFDAEFGRRLAATRLVVPPLRERREDIPELVHYFIAECNQRYGRDVGGVDDGAMVRLCGYPWPGNVRELRQAVEHAVMVATGSAVEVGDLPVSVSEFRRPDAG